MYIGMGRNDGKRRRRARRKSSAVTQHAVFADGFIMRSVKVYTNLAITHAWRVSMRRSDGSVANVGGFTASVKRAEEHVRSWVRLAKPRPVLFAGVSEAVEGDVVHP